MSKKNLPNIPLYIGDWERDCNVLSLETEMAWMKIIFKMHLNGKQSTYKTSTKGLQILWKSNAEKCQEIIDELLFNEIGGISVIEGGYIFYSRRLEKEESISKVRSEAVKNRYKNDKSSTNPLQNSNKTLQNTDNDNDIDYDNVNEIKVKDEIEVFGKSENLLAIQTLKTEIQNEFTWKETVCRNMKEVKPNFTPEEFDNYLEQFFKQIENDGEEVKTIQDTKKHFSRWLNIEIKKSNEQTSNTKQGATNDFRRKTAERLGIVQS